MNVNVQNNMVKEIHAKYLVIIRELEMLKELAILVNSEATEDCGKNETATLYAKIQASILPSEKSTIKISHVRDVKTIFSGLQAIGFEPNPEEKIVIELKN